MINELRKLEENNYKYDEKNDETGEQYRELILKQENNVLNKYINTLEEHNCISEADTIRSIMRNYVKRGTVLKKLYNLYYDDDREVYL